MLNLKSKSKSFVVVGAISAVVLISLYAFAAMTVQSQRQPKQLTKVEVTPLPTVDYQSPAPASLKEQELRQTRSSRHNGSTFNVKELPPNVYQLPLISHLGWHLSAIPASQSDAIVVGEVKSADAYLSTDKTGVYSEFTIQIEQVLKAVVNISPASIVAERRGGAVRFPSGRVIRYEVLDQGMPRVGSRYLLFLKYNGEGDDFSVLTGYELKDNSVFPLDEAEGRFAEYKNWPESAFFNLVVTTIKGGQ